MIHFVRNALRAVAGRARLGDVVTLEDATPYAKPGHRACQGRGFVTYVAGRYTIPQVCACASAAFQRANLERLEPSGKAGESFVWRLDNDPRRTTAMARGLVAGLAIAVVGLLVAVVTA
jgi:hypothetical protein